ncbi:hypothetical protein BSZ21_05335 [Bradyrhizobium canariense]|uniref:hypothetical protein n=1 Tax=Bradyrhizobium canariense TaxID=255045 RepID=UPI000A191BEE|nr:hypothetical protein [Bradyrhizobium canariense]OSI74980.1 hypothetical protein BSZ21_05335 [Bradyrhizobium canariense]
MDRQLNGRRKARAGGFGLQPQVPQAPAAQRRRDVRRAQEEAKSKFPRLESKLDKIKNGIRDARLSGRRFAYKEPLRDLYELAYGWYEEDKLDERIRQVANLRAICVRKANPFSVLIRAVLDEDADRKTVSRWSVALNEAMENEVAPTDVGEYL